LNSDFSRFILKHSTKYKWHPVSGKNMRGKNIYPARFIIDFLNINF